MVGSASPGAPTNAIGCDYLISKIGEEQWQMGQCPEIPETEILQNPYQYRK